MALFGKPRSKLLDQLTSQQASTPAPMPMPRAPLPAPAAPLFDDPQDARRWKLMSSLDATLSAMMAKNSECFDTAEQVEKAYAMADSEYVNGIRQHEISRQNFRTHGTQSEHRLSGLLAELRSLTLVAQGQWNDLIALLPGDEPDVMKIANWAMSHRVDTAVLSSVLANGMFLNTDFGMTRASFWAEDERVAEVMRNAGY